jgi:hypothetical protein
VSRFLRRDLHPRGGSHFLVKQFYDSIVHDAPLPISYREIVLTVSIMDDIFAQIYRSAPVRVPALLAR